MPRSSMSTAIAAPVAVLLDLERDDAPAAPLDRLEHRARAPARRNLDEQPVDLGPEAANDPVGEDPERTERQQRETGRDERGAVVAGARRHADRRDEPERRGGREPAHGEALADDRARAEEADAADDLRGDARRVGTHDRTRRARGTR